MAFLFDLINKFGKSPHYTVVNFDGKFIYLDGITRIREITTTIIKVIVANEEVIIEGENLQIDEMDGDSITIKGAISCVKKS